jgi:NADH:ubiquinone oxidoreductase subunit 4 (subunit M)
VSFLVTLPLISGFNNKTAALQFVEKQPWIDRFNVFYHLGVDGLSVWFVLLTAFITVIVVIAGWEVITEKRGPVHGRLPDPVGPDGGRVQRPSTGCCSTSSSKPR